MVRIIKNREYRFRDQDVRVLRTFKAASIELVEYRIVGTTERNSVNAGRFRKEATLLEIIHI